LNDDELAFWLREARRYRANDTFDVLQAVQMPHLKDKDRRKTHRLIVKEMEYEDLETDDRTEQERAAQVKQNWADLRGMFPAKGK
jgi:hypothetical protein